jgi:hypothetical protein
LAEIAFLTIQEMGLQVAGVAEEIPKTASFLGYSVQRMAEVSLDAYDRVVVASLDLDNGIVKRLVALGVPADRIITLSGSATHAVVTQPSPTASDSIVPAAETEEFVMIKADTANP